MTSTPLASGPPAIDQRRLLVIIGALLLGMLLATTAFTVLTAASRTSQLRTVGTVSAHFVPAYEILVRPTEQER